MPEELVAADQLWWEKLIVLEKLLSKYWFQPIDGGGRSEGGVPLPSLHEGHGGCCPAEGK